MPLVDIPNVGEVEFPDEMSEDEIAVAIQRDIIRDVMPKVPAPGESEMLRAGQTPGAPTQAFPAVQERMAATAELPALSGEEAEQMVTTPYAEVPQTVARAPGEVISRLPGVELAAAMFPETAKGAKAGAANLTKNLIEQSLMTPLSGPMAVATLVPPVRAALGAVLSAGAAKGAAERLGEGSVTGDPQTITEGVGMAGLAGLGALGTGLDIARSQPGAFARALANENFGGKAPFIPVELVRPPLPTKRAGTPLPDVPLLPESTTGPRAALPPAPPPAPPAPNLTPQQAALLPRTAAAVKQLTEGKPSASQVQQAAEVHGPLLRSAQEGESAKAVPVEEGQPGVRTEEAVAAPEVQAQPQQAVTAAEPKVSPSRLSAASPDSLESAGATREAIFQQTGMWKGPGGKWVSDVAAVEVPESFTQRYFDAVKRRDKGPVTGYELNELIGQDHPLFKQHPELSKLRIYIDLQAKKAGGSFGFIRRDEQGWIHVNIPTKAVWNKAANRAEFVRESVKVDESKKLGEGKYQTVRENPSKLLSQVVNHEINHAIQKKLGLPEGGSSLDYFLDKNLKWNEQEAGGAAYDYYRSLAGEALARLSEVRAKMTPAEKMAEPPWVTFETMLTKEGLIKPGQSPDEVLTVKLQGKVVKSSPPPSGRTEVPATPQETPAPPAQVEAGGAAPPAGGPPSDQALGLIPPVPPIIKDIASAVGTVLDWYSQPLTERLASAGGPTAKGFSNMAKEIVYRQKALYGSITPILDPALRATGRLNRTTTWLNDIAPTTKKWGYRNSVAAIEGPISAVPPEHQPTVKLLKDANLAVGQMAQPVIPGFTATGLMQRNLTAAAVDAIRSGRGPLLDGIIEALSTDNGIPVSRVKKLFADFKAEFDAPGSKQTISRISQEFHRHFKKFPTDIKVTIADLGHRKLRASIWVPILHAKPFEYLSHSALETSQRVAFLERIPQGTLDPIRKQVVAELKDPAPFDELVRALHGLSVDQPWRFAPPGTKLHLMLSGIDRVLSDVFGELKLSASAIVNIPETIIGNTPAFYGWRNFAKGSKSLPAQHQALETLGAIDINMYNWSLDPKAPMRTILSGFRYGMRKATMRQFFNELQEKSAASTAYVFGALAKGKLLSAREQGLFTEAAVAHGFSRQASEAMAKGHATPEQYDDFTRRAAPFATGGHIAPAERSRWANTRIISSMVKWQNYPQMKMNAARKVWENFADAMESGDKERAKRSGEILSKFIFNTIAQGAGATFLYALFSGRKGGVVETIEDALEGPGAFLLDSFLTGMAGPFAAIHYAFSSGRMRDVLDPRNLNSGLVFPGAIALEMKQLFNREGPYAGMTLKEAAQRYAKTKVPAGRVIVRALRAAGLLDEADDSLTELYQRVRRWREESEDPQVVKQREQLAGQKFPESKYAALRQALKVNDRPRARREYRELLKVQDRDVIRRTMEANRPFTGSWELERKFRRSLDAEGRKLYRDAQRERERLAAKFRAIAP